MSESMISVITIEEKTTDHFFNPNLVDAFSLPLTRVLVGLLG
jgi:hypothetical protein